MLAGDKVLLKSASKENKLSANVESNPYVVLERNGAEITCKESLSDKVVRRNVQFSKRYIEQEDDGLLNSEPEVELSEPVELAGAPSVNAPPPSEPPSISPMERPRRSVRPPTWHTDYHVS